MAGNLPHDSVIPYQESNKGKKEQVAEMFDRIAGRYDLMNRFLSARSDVAWRKKALSRFKKDAPATLLDIATGTADMAIMACNLLPVQNIQGIDISEAMLTEGRKKIEKAGLTGKITLSKGDAETINFAANTFDAGMVAFGVRNFENLEKGLSEILRVLKPGAQLVIIEFATPRQPIKGLYNFYMQVIAPVVARMFGQNVAAYKYLNKSTNAFPDRHNFTAILNKTGFINTQFQSLSLGICCIYSAYKPTV